MFILVLIGGAEACTFNVDGINGDTGDGGAVGNTSVAQRHLMVLVVKEFPGEELVECGSSTRYFRWELCFPVIITFVHAWQWKKILERGANHGGVRNRFRRCLEERWTLLLAFEVLSWGKQIFLGLVEVS